MRIVFMGSADFACPSLRRLVSDGIAEVVGVVTQPDRPRGRGLGVSPSPVKQCALELGIGVLTPEKVNGGDGVASIKALTPDLLVVVAYGQILKPELLSVAPKGCINVHGSLLPRYRGAAPIQWAIANGESVTGVTVMFLNERMDAGDIILQSQVSIGSDDTAGTLHDKLAANGASLLASAVQAMDKGVVSRTPQNDNEATYALKLSKHDGKIDWTRTAEEIYNRLRAFDPWPGSFCEVAESGKGKQNAGFHVLKIVRLAIEAGTGKPGEVISVDGGGPLVATGNKAVRLLEVQPEGKKAMTGSAFLRGHDIKQGEILR